MSTTEDPKICPAGECDGSGAIWGDECTCGTGPSGYHGAHEPGCGSEPCPAGCWQAQTWTDDLITFLNARLDEGEARARATAHPARALREVNVMRRIARRCAACMNELDVYPNGLVSPCAMLARQILMEAAAAYSDFPGYRQEWKP